MSPPRKDRHPNGASPPTNPGRFCRPSRTTLTSSSRPRGRLPDGRPQGRTSDADLSKGVHCCCRAHRDARDDGFGGRRPARLAEDGGFPRQGHRRFVQHRRRLLAGAIRRGWRPGLWRTDGTPGGTVMVKALGAHDLTNVNGTLFFASSFSPFSTFGSDSLWTRDGTAAGTVLVVGDSLQPPPPLRFSGFTAVNGTLFFVQHLDQLFSLWRSDGTTEGTVLVKDINPGAGNSLPSSLTNVNGTLFFAAFHPD